MDRPANQANPLSVAATLQYTQRKHSSKEAMKIPAASYLQGNHSVIAHAAHPVMIDETPMPTQSETVESPHPRLSDLPHEIANTITHGLGLLFSLLALVVIGCTFITQSPYWITISSLIYCLSLISVYGASTLSHSIQKPQRKELWRAIGQAVIYLHIPAASTPFLLTYSCDYYWWLLVPFIWSVALVGFAAKILIPHKLCLFSLASYLTLGWVPLIAIGHAFELLSGTAVAFAVVGGCCYTLGTYFLMNDHKAWYYHSIWHLLVIVGSAIHFYTNLAYIIPVSLQA